MGGWDTVSQAVTFSWGENKFEDEEETRKQGVIGQVRGFSVLVHEQDSLFRGSQQ